MPSFTYHRSPSPSSAMPIPIYESLPSKTVDFIPIPTPTQMTHPSRPLTNDELWTLYYFEAHARLCAACRDPYHVHRAGGRLCSRGHVLAQAVARFVWSTSNGRETFATASQNGHPVALEMPADYSEVKDLLHAMERSLRHRRQVPIVSFDSLHGARATASAKSQSSRPKSWAVRTPSTSPQRYPRREPEIVNWPDVEYEIRQPAHVIQPHRSQPKPRNAETKKYVNIGAASSFPPSRTSPSKRNSYQAVPPSSSPSRKSVIQAPQVSPSRQRSRTISSAEIDARRRSMYADGGVYNVEVREPKSRQKRHSMFLF